MKKFYLFIIICCTSLISFAQNAKSLKEYKLDKSTIVKDSAGKVLAPEAWYYKVQSNEYTLQQITEDDVEPREFLLRICTTDEKRMAMMRTERTEPITLAGFTTGKPIKDFTVTDINGNTYTKESLMGKVVVINFWFKDASPCKAEIPELNNLVQKYKSKDVVFLAPTYDPLGDVLEFLKKVNFSYTICTDVDEMIINMKVTKYPTHVVVDKQGIVQFVTIGQTDNIFDQLDFEINNSL